MEVYLGLGSNEGDREQLMAEAITLLSVALGAPVRLSATIETEPWGFSSPNPFLNMSALFETDMTPTELLDTTEEIERRLGRKSKSTAGVYSDRPMDIDILLYGNECISTERLTIPHPRIAERLFVLEPLEEIAPDLIHPVIGKSIKKLAENARKSKDDKNHRNS